MNNAGVSCPGPMAEIPLKDVRNCFDANVFGVLSMVQAVFPHMAKQVCLCPRFLLDNFIESLYCYREVGKLLILVLLWGIFVHLGMERTVQLNQLFIPLLMP